MSNERIELLEKVSKLVDLSDRSTFDGEATTARKMAAKLIAKYDLDVTRLSQGEEITVDFLETGKSRQDRQFSGLVKSISDYCGVYTILRSRYDVSYMFTGTRTNIDAALYMINALSSQGEELVRKWYADHKRNYGASMKRRNDYRRGVFVGITENLRKIAQDVYDYKQEHGLVVVDPNKVAQDAAQEHYAKYFGKVNKAKKKTYVCGSTFHDGRAAGGGISLRKPIEAPTTQTKRIA